jgi:hypothetical protein
VLTALENGGISQKRYDNFIKMLEESKANTQSIIEKKRKTRDSGKKYRSAKKFQKK